MKIAINTIAKNEAANTEAFVAACAGADLVTVLDTGSSDGTRPRAEDAPWRYPLRRGG